MYRYTCDIHVVTDFSRIAFEHHERIVRAFEDVNEDYLVVVGTLGVNRSTARSIVSRYVREAGLLILRDGAISHNRPQIASDRTIHKKSHNSQKIAHYSPNQP